MMTSYTFGDLTNCYACRCNYLTTGGFNWDGYAIRPWGDGTYANIVLTTVQGSNGGHWLAFGKYA